MRRTHFRHTEIDDNSYNDYDYDMSSVYLTKLEIRSRRLNKSKNKSTNRGDLHPDLIEVDPQFEATPIGKKEASSNETKLYTIKEPVNTGSVTSFNGACLAQEKK
mmetsp:Transcript_13210/g.15299  ORF Transcript_13210/g.15299 Transcript_13210/m.15299 type:complete len:105 (+) Transcript_13210:383-697(+)